MFLTILLLFANAAMDQTVHQNTYYLDALETLWIIYLSISDPKAANVIVSYNVENENSPQCAIPTLS